MSTRTIIGAVLAASLLIMSGCSTPPEIGHPNVLNQSEIPAPDWINTVPEAAQGFATFVGRSSATASERLAMDQARQDVIQQAVEYLGGFAERDFEQRRTSMGLESSVLDPTAAARDLRDYVAQNFVSQILTKATYWEYRRTPGGDAYFGYVLIPFPINQSMTSFAEQQITAAQQRVRDAQTDEAKKPAQDALEFWETTKSMFPDR